MSDRRISFGSRVSSTGIALISKPVNGQYTIIIVARKPVTVTGVWGTKLSTFIEGNKQDRDDHEGNNLKGGENIFGHPRKRDTGDV